MRRWIKSKHTVSGLAFGIFLSALALALAGGMKIYGAGTGMQEQAEVYQEEELEEKETNEEAAEQQEEEGIQFYLKQQTSSDIDTYSFDNSATLPVSNVRYDKFLSKTGGSGTTSTPNMGMGIKYIEGDDKNVDGGGKWRYVYCVEFKKDCPIGGLGMEFIGWNNRKIAYAMYYGALYYGYPCRFGPYSTGDWQMDYFVTQVAIHILNGEYTLAAARNGMNQSNATTAEKNLAYDRIEKIVNGANNSNNYGGFTGDGWLNMDQAKFSLNGYSDSWQLINGNYLSGGTFHGVFTSYYGYDFREQLTGYEISVPQGAYVEKSGKETYSDFRVGIPEKQYKRWQLTGKKIPVTVTASIPRYWGAGIYRCKAASNFQDVCLLTWDGSGGTTKMEQTANLNIPQVTADLTIYKKDQNDGSSLKGAKFSLWGYEDNAYSKKIGEFEDMQDGSYQLKNIAYTDTEDGWFLIREEEPPEHYSAKYQLKNSKDEEEYQKYGGRQVRMNENGFYSPWIEEPEVFCDEKAASGMHVAVKKYDGKTKEVLPDAEFQVFPWIQENGTYSTVPEQTLIFNSESRQYETVQMLKADGKNQGKFLIRETKVPAHYSGRWQQEITVTEAGTTDLVLEAYNYPERKFTIWKKIRADEVVWNHGTPTFFFRISGKDLDGIQRWYQCMIHFTKESVKEQEYLVGKAEVNGIPAGQYQVEELPLTARYILTDASSSDPNVTVKNTLLDTVNGIQKIRSEITADLTLEDGSVIFENRKVFFDEYSHDDVEVNHLKASEEKNGKKQ